MGARNGSMLGRSIFKVYKKGKPGSEHACFSYCQPEYFYGVSAGDDHLGDYSTVYYSYPLDILEARRMFGDDKPFKSEAQLGRENRYEPTPETDATVMGRDS